MPETGILPGRSREGGTGRKHHKSLFDNELTDMARACPFSLPIRARNLEMRGFSKAPKEGPKP